MGPPVADGKNGIARIVGRQDVSAGGKRADCQIGSARSVEFCGADGGGSVKKHYAAGGDVLPDVRLHLRRKIYHATDQRCWERPQGDLRKEKCWRLP